MGHLKQLVKRAFCAATPETATAVLSARARARSQQLVREWGLLDLNRKLIDRFGSTVQAGPFRGMTLSPMTHADALGPFLLGCFEAELHDWVEAVASSRFAQVLDVGAKFGYYAVGLARRLPDTPVVAFDTDWWARAATAEMAVMNRTPNVTAARFCSPRWLDRYLEPGSFILSDCEGYEGELFPRSRTPALDTATLLIEIHEGLSPGVGAAIRERFCRTHTVATVRSAKRTSSPIDLGFLTPSEAAAAVLEVRDPDEWMLFTPRAGDPGCPGEFARTSCADTR